MVNGKRGILIGMCALVLGGCSSVLSCDDGHPVRWFSSQTEHLLNNAISNYEDGNYTASMASLQELVANKDAKNGEKVRAYKYMAFIHCVSSRETMCAESFKKALELDPNFTLGPAEIGHPIWGAVFKSVKSKNEK